MADVFVSYKREDAAKVRKLVEALRGDGLDVWWDQDILPSAPWETTIERALSDANAVIVCWSTSSVASENVRSEARLAREDGRLIQVFVSACSPPLFFGERQGVDLSSWRGNSKDSRIRAVADSIRAIAGAERHKEPEKHKLRSLLEYRIHIGLAIILLLAGSFAGWWFLSPARAAGPQTLAVLPFRALNPADANLVDAIWDDTRGAISRNPNLRVLGREAVEALAKKDLSPSDYRRKVGADYLLDGSVEHQGNDVHMKVSLTRTKDGAEVWSDEIGGKLDDVFSFQARIANEVEGRIRGRVAPGGGATERNIATSGEVYAIFAEARSKVRLRDPGNASAAVVLLRKALSIDPNYAPAWANLGVATFFAASNQPTLAPARTQAIADIKRALTLAPNLAYAHAALAMVQSFPPESEIELRKAVALDPGSADAWTWLGNLYMFQNRVQEAVDVQTRAVDIEPLWWTAVGNKVAALVINGDHAGLEAELKRIQQTQDAVLLEKVRWRIANVTGHPGDAAAILLHLRAEHPEEEPWIDLRLPSSLIPLGFVEEVVQVRKLPLERAAELRGTPLSPEALDAKYKTAGDFWEDAETAVGYSKLLPTHGRLEEWLRRYRASFGSADDFVASFTYRLPVLQTISPTVACDLRASGQGAEADAILQRTEPAVLGYLRNGPPNFSLLATAAFFRAANGKADEAIRLLDRAVNFGWVPDGPVDIAQEPCFIPFASRPDFQALRQRILTRMALERRKISPVMLANSGLEAKAA